jgi:hypothetical protein
MLLFVGLFAVIALAMVGAVIALAVLAVGAVVHGVMQLGRGRQAAHRSPPAGERVIEGEFRVIEPHRPAAKPAA